MHHHLHSAEASETGPGRPLVIDIHTHTYPPSYVSLLSSRTSVPYIHHPSDGSDPRLIILNSDDDESKPRDKRGRPVDKTYSSWEEKLKFMTRHDIDISVVSLANPWLDFLPPDTALETAGRINDDLNAACGSQNNPNHAAAADSSSAHVQKKLYAFACLPLSAGPAAVTTEIARLASLPYVKGVIMGTTGLGRGLDDPALDPVWSSLAATATLVFLHPHYGLPTSAYGPDAAAAVANSGHVIPLALGFPLETTIAVTRMYLAGVYDRFPALTMLLAHSGGTLPFLAGRIQSCVDHERVFLTSETSETSETSQAGKASEAGGTSQASKTSQASQTSEKRQVPNPEQRTGPRRSIWDVLNTNVYLDAVIYAQAGLAGAIEAAGGTKGTGAERVMFGTDHPFFPPLRPGATEWLSVQSNKEAIDGVAGEDAAAAARILGGNAARVLGIDVP